MTTKEYLKRAYKLDREALMTVSKLNMIRQRLYGRGQSDVTDEAIAAVFTWFTQFMEDNEEHSITYKSSEFELVMRRKDVDA